MAKKIKGLKKKDVDPDRAVWERQRRWTERRAADVKVSTDAAVRMMRATMLGWSFGRCIFHNDIGLVDWMIGEPGKPMENQRLDALDFPSGAKEPFGWLMDRAGVPKF